MLFTASCIVIIVTEKDEILFKICHKNHGHYIKQQAKYFSTTFREENMYEVRGLSDEKSPILVYILFCNSNINTILMS
jgi:hypothetical protein